MKNTEIQKGLNALKKGVTEIGIKFLNSKTPIKVDEIRELLKPFADLEKCFDEAIKKFSDDN